MAELRIRPMESIIRRSIICIVHNKFGRIIKTITNWGKI